MLSSRRALWWQASYAVWLLLVLWLLKCGLIYWAAGFKPQLAFWPQLNASLAPMLLAAVGGLLFSLHWLESRSARWSKPWQGMAIGVLLLLLLLLYSMFEGHLSHWLLASLAPASGGVWRQVLFYWQSHFLGALVLFLPLSMLLARRTQQPATWAAAGRAESLGLMLLCQLAVLLPWLGLLPWQRLNSPSSLAVAVWCGLLANAALMLGVRYGLAAQRVRLRPWRLAACAVLVPMLYLYGLTLILTQALRIYLAQGLPALGWPISVLLLSLLLALLAPCYVLALRWAVKPSASGF